MQEEYDALLKNKIWHLVPRRFNKNLIDCKWVYRIKKTRWHHWQVGCRMLQTAVW
jgi:hypothetical protein